ncbi:MAG: nucleotidyltransferase domain-containing protein [Candidatus Pacebacteria bacterium]|nr:nucleotidyltransferase domain-containing protein [Candidatus Paceibacterota bacterium]
MEEKLTQYIKEKYDPVAILIHGSRSNNYAREHSDWDFAILVEKDTEVEREIIEGANVEIRVLKLPFNTHNIADRWIAFREGNVKVLFDPQNITLDIIKEVTEYYNKPIIWKPSDISGHKAWFRSQVDGMTDYQNENEAFFRKLGELYLRCIQYWFHFLHHTYMPQVYLSLPRIQKEDPEYYELLKVLASNVSNKEKIDTAEKIYKKIWK